MAQPNPSEDLSDRLITLQGEGEGPSLFAVGVFHFQALAEQLGAERPFYGLLGQDVDAEVPYLDQVGELARRYVDVLRQAQPEGPYHLIGFCFGGLVAYEMARQLRASGAPMGALVLVDAFPPDVSAVADGSTQRSGRIARHWGALKEGGGKYIVEWAKRRQAYERTRARKLGKRLRESASPVLERVSSDPGRDAARHEAEAVAANSYVPGPYDGDALIVAGTADLHQSLEGAYDAEHEAGRWRDHITGSVDVNVFQSELHDDLLAEPLVADLAKIIHKEIAWASAKTEALSEDL